jgi:hypothetical protein
MRRKKTIPVQVVTPRNSWGFSSTRKYVEMPHALKVKYIDPGSNWQINEQVVYADGYNKDGSGEYKPGVPYKVATLFEDLDTFACTSPSMAWRIGRYFMAQVTLRQDQISFNQDVEHIAYTKGDLIRYQHDVMRVGGYPVRVRSVSGKNVIVDAPVTIDPAKDYQIEVRGNDGSIFKTDVTDIDVTGYTIVVFDSAGIEPGNLLIYGVKELVSIDLLITTITPSSDLSASITAVELAPEILNADQGDIEDYNPQLGDDIVEGGVAPPPPDAVANERLSHVNRQAYSIVTLNWVMDPTYSWSTMEIYKQNEDGGYDLIDYSASPSSQWSEAILASENFTNVVEDVTVCYKLRPIGTTGEAVALDDVPITCITLVGDQLGPDIVKYFNLNVLSETILLTWEAPESTDIGFFVLKYTPETSPGVNWNEGNYFIERIAHDLDSIEVPARIGTYMLKVVDTSGNASDEFVKSITTIPELLNLDLIKEIKPEPDWDGTKSQTEIVGNELRLVRSGDSYPSEGIYQYDDLTDLGEIYTVRVSSYIDMYGFLAGEVVADWNPLSSVLRLVNIKEGDAKAVCEVRTSDSDISISQWPTMDVIDPIAQGSVEWTEWRIVHSTDVTGRILQFRLRLISKVENVTPSIRSGFVSIDVPERSLREADRICPIGGETVIFEPGFFSVPVVNITQDNAVIGDYFKITNKTKDQFMIEFFDNTDASVSRQYDYLARGVGIAHDVVIG